MLHLYILFLAKQLISSGTRDVIAEAENFQLAKRCIYTLSKKGFFASLHPPGVTPWNS